MARSKGEWALALAAGLLLGPGAALAAASGGLTVDFSAPPLDLPMAPAQQPMGPVAARPPAASDAAPPLAPPGAAPARPAGPLSPAPPQAVPAPAAGSAGPVSYGAGDLAAQPTPQQIIDAYPEAGRLMSVRAKVSLNCQVAASGQVHDCTVASESSRGTGFGEAALRLQSYYRMRPKVVNGQPASGVTTLLVNFSPTALKAAGGVWPRDKP